MESKVSYTVVGLFVLLLGAALGALVLWLSVGEYRTDSHCYYVYMQESVSGLSADAAVKYRGVEVGQVQRIRLRPNNPEEVWLSLAVAADTPVKTDTVATLSLQGLTGLAFVNLTGGSRQATPLRPRAGEPCPVIETKPSVLVRLDEALSLLLENFQNLSEDISRLLNDDTRSHVKQILEHTAQLTRTLAAQQETIKASLDSAAQTLKRSEQASAQLPETLEAIRHSAAAMQRMAHSITTTSASTTTLLETNQQYLSRFTSQTLPEIGLLVHELRQLTTHVQQFAQQVTRQPNSLLYGRQSPRRGPGE